MIEIPDATVSMKLRYCIAISLILHGIAILSLSSYDYQVGGDRARQIHILVRHDSETSSSARKIGHEIAGKAESFGDTSRESIHSGGLTRQAHQSSNQFEGTAPYRSTKELDMNPAPLNEIDIDVFDHETIRNNIKATLVLYINAQGLVDKVEPEDSSIPEEYLQKIIEIFKKSHFSPGMKDGKSVNSKMKIEVGLEK